MCTSYCTVEGLVPSPGGSGAQVGVASLAVIYLEEEGINASKASLMFSLCQITFTIGRQVMACSVWKLLTQALD